MDHTMKTLEVWPTQEARAWPYGPGNEGQVGRWSGTFRLEDMVNPGLDPSLGPCLVLIFSLTHYERGWQKRKNKMLCPEPSVSLNKGEGEQERGKNNNNSSRGKVCFFSIFTKRILHFSLFRFLFGFPPLIKSKLLHDLLLGLAFLCSTCMVSFCNFYKRSPGSFHIF